MLFEVKGEPRRTIADHEALDLIAPLANLGCFEVAADFFLSLCITISLPSGAIRANSSWLAIVLLAPSHIKTCRM